MNWQTQTGPGSPVRRERVGYVISDEFGEIGMAFAGTQAPNTQAEANAELMASAPALKAKLQELQPHATEDTTPQEAVTSGRHGFTRWPRLSTRLRLSLGRGPDGSWLPPSNVEVVYDVLLFDDAIHRQLVGRALTNKQRTATRGPVTINIISVRVLEPKEVTE